LDKMNCQTTLTALSETRHLVDRINFSNMKTTWIATPLMLFAPFAVYAPHALAQTTEQPNAQGKLDTVVVKKILFAGVFSIPEVDLLFASGFVAGKTYSIAELREIAMRVTEAYRKQGYFLAQTFLPPQEIEGGLIRLQVEEGRFGQVNTRNRSKMSASTVEAVTQDFQRMGAINQWALERRLLLLADIPGIQVKSSLTPGTVVGTSDLALDLTDTARWNAMLEADNHGSSSTGAHRLGASLSLNQPLGIADQASARVLTSGRGLAYGRVSYQAMAGWISLGVAHTQVQYELGGTFAGANVNGTARTNSLFASYAIIRSKDRNLNVQWTLDQKNLSDRLGSALPTEKHATASIISLRGDFLDAQGTGQVSYTTQWTRGNLNLRSQEAVEADRITAQSRGRFDKLAYALTYQKAVAADTVLHLNVNGQWASKNLDASEKFSLGGPQGVRAYPGGEAPGDEGAVLTLEARTGLPKLSQQLSGQLQWIAFVDVGAITVNKKPWDAAVNSRSLRAGGLGIAFQGKPNWTLKAYYAAKLNSSAATTETDSRGRFWVQASASF
jgi:hemolysin activation/secretion protein